MLLEKVRSDDSKRAISEAEIESLEIAIGNIKKNHLFRFGSTKSQLTSTKHQSSTYSTTPSEDRSTIRPYRYKESKSIPSTSRNATRRSIRLYKTDSTIATTSGIGISKSIRSLTNESTIAAKNRGSKFIDSIFRRINGNGKQKTTPNTTAAIQLCTALDSFQPQSIGQVQLTKFEQVEVL